MLCLACPFPNNAHAQKPIWKRLCILIDNRNFCFEFWQRVYAPQNAFQLTHFICMTKQWFCIASLQKICRAPNVFQCWGKKYRQIKLQCMVKLLQNKKKFNSNSSSYPFKFSPGQYEMRKLQGPEESGCGWWKREMLSFKK